MDRSPVFYCPNHVGPVSGSQSAPERMRCHPEAYGGSAMSDSYQESLKQLRRLYREQKAEKRAERWRKLADAASTVAFYLVVILVALTAAAPLMWFIFDLLRAL